MLEEKITMTQQVPSLNMEVVLNNLHKYHFMSVTDIVTAMKNSIAELESQLTPLDSCLYLLRLCQALILNHNREKEIKHNIQSMLYKHCSAINASSRRDLFRTSVVTLRMLETTSSSHILDRLAHSCSELLAAKYPDYPAQENYAVTVHSSPKQWCMNRLIGIKVDVISQVVKSLETNNGMQLHSFYYVAGKSTKLHYPQVYTHTALCPDLNFNMAYNLFVYWTAALAVFLTASGQQQTLDNIIMLIGLIKKEINVFCTSALNSPGAQALAPRLDQVKQLTKDLSASSSDIHVYTLAAYLYSFKK